MKHFFRKEEILISDGGTIKRTDAISVLTIIFSTIMIIILCYLGVMALI